MSQHTPTERIALCSWSLQPTDPQDLVAKIKATGISRIQLALDPLRDTSQTWGDAPTQLRQNGITVVSGMAGCVGEDYTTLDSIRVTGGVAPDANWEQNLGNFKSSAALARQMGLPLVTLHAGFLPHDETDPVFAKMLGRLTLAADAFAAVGIAVGLETGQETAPCLRRVLQKLNRPNVGVNFDPANMVLYDKGDPIEALRLLGPWVRQVHIKDATRTKVPGTWGAEVPVGTGEVDWPKFFATLRDAGFTGNYVIEREAGTQRVADIRTARDVVEKWAK